MERIWASVICAGCTKHRKVKAVNADGDKPYIEPGERRSNRACEGKFGGNYTYERCSRSHRRQAQTGIRYLGRSRRTCGRYDRFENVDS